MILEQNQYPSFFYEPIIKKTLDLIINHESVKTKDKAQIDLIKDNFKMFIEYRGKSTEHILFITI